MPWSLDEAIVYYSRQGAPGDQSALVALLREVQRENGGTLWPADAAHIAAEYGLKDSFLQAVIKRIPSLRMAGGHRLELCGGPNCPRRARLAAFVEKTYGQTPPNVTVKHTPCMHHCADGPNIKWDGVLYSHADEALLRKLIESAQ
jgi:NADH:ubiquinone oxidoreductase subunit E